MQYQSGRSNGSSDSSNRMNSNEKIEKEDKDEEEDDEPKLLSWLTRSHHGGSIVAQRSRRKEFGLPLSPSSQHDDNDEEQENLRSSATKESRRRQTTIGTITRGTTRSDPKRRIRQNMKNTTKSQRMAQLELFDVQRRLLRRSFVGVKLDRHDQQQQEQQQQYRKASVSFGVDEKGEVTKPLIREAVDESSSKNQQKYGAFTEDSEEQNKQIKADHLDKLCLYNFIQQIPAIAVVVLLLLMTAIPFGNAFFPIEWKGGGGVAAADSTNDDGDSDGGGGGGSFPLPGKASIGIRMALFATAVGQLAQTFTSNFKNPIIYQLIENVPFYHALANIVFEEQGYGMEALSTLFFLFGLASVMVGLMFGLLGKLQLGRIVYFIPSHVLVGCIGGIGVFIIKTSIEVTNNEDFTFTLDGIRSLVNNIHLFGVVIVFETILRLLDYVLRDKDGNPKFTLLAPIYFCSIVPMFYLLLFVVGVDVETAKDIGYFLPDPSAESCTSSFDSNDNVVDPCLSLSFNDKVFDGHILDIFRVIDFRTISWVAVMRSFGTLIALSLFSLMQVPLFIPAFAVSTNVDDFDMNQELIAHGWSNALSGIFGGLQNVMTYSFSVLYHKSGGYGKPSSLVLVAVTIALFVYGPAIATLIPRAMAGTLLLHIGIDLFLEGVYDSYCSYDSLEYSGIWLITIVMSVFGMTAAMIAGFIAALSTYAVQSIMTVDPIFRIFSASTLRGSQWARPSGALAILEDDETGRRRVMIVQLQGHLFFGNVVLLTDTVKQILNEKKGTPDEPLVVIFDFTLVVRMDSSAAHAIAKLKDVMVRLFKVEVTIFVTGSHRDSFPCEYALEEALCKHNDDETLDFNDVNVPQTDEASTGKPRSTLARARRSSIIISLGSKAMKASVALRCIPKNRVCDNLDEALIFAEDILVARENPYMLRKDCNGSVDPLLDLDEVDAVWTEEEEKDTAKEFLDLHVPVRLGSDADASREATLHFLISKFKREEYQKDDILWEQGSESGCAKLIISGKFVASLEETDVSETVRRGDIVGELGLVEGTKRLSTVTCVSKSAIVYSLDKSVWESIGDTNPNATLMMHKIVIRNLTHRVQHVSNRIFETRCLPI